MATRGLPRNVFECRECYAVTQSVDERGWCLMCVIDEISDLASRVCKRLIQARRDGDTAFLRAMEAAAATWEAKHL